ncbi:hypothetical protein ABKV19_006175 [Rosa sericea]
MTKGGNVILNGVPPLRVELLYPSRKAKNNTDETYWSLSQPQVIYSLSLFLSIPTTNPLHISFPRVVYGLEV